MELVVYAGVIDIIGGQLGYIWNELQSKNGGHTYERFFACFEVGESTSNPDFRSRKTHTWSTS